jgi:hypothetical protein
MISRTRKDYAESSALFELIAERYETQEPSDYSQPAVLGPE